MATTDHVCPSCKVAATQLGAKQLSSGCAPPSRNSTRDTINCVAQESLRVATVNMVDHSKCSLARVHKVICACGWILRVCWCWMLIMWLLNIESLLVLNIEMWLLKVTGARCLCEWGAYPTKGEWTWEPTAKVLLLTMCLLNIESHLVLNVHKWLLNVETLLVLFVVEYGCWMLRVCLLRKNEVFVVCRSNTSKLTRILSVPKQPTNRWFHKHVRFQDLSFYDLVQIQVLVGFSSE